MTISSIPAEQGRPTDLRIDMECATNECVTSLGIIAEYAANCPGADAVLLAKQINDVLAIVLRFMNTKHQFQPGRVSRLVEKKYEDISVAMTTLAEDVRERDYRAAKRTVNKIRQLAMSVSLLLQVETN